MQERMAELESLKRATPDSMDKEAEAFEARLSQQDKELVANAETKRLVQNFGKLQYGAALKDIEKLKPTPAVHQILQKRLLALKFRNQQGLEEELTPVRSSALGEWLQKNVIDKRLHLEDGMREIDKKLRANLGLAENKRLDPSADKALLETMLLLTISKNKPQLDVEFQRYRELVYNFRFYMFRCIYLSNALDPKLAKDEKKKEERYRRVVANIIKMEKDEQTADFGGNDVKRLYRELLEDDELLKKAYVAEGGSALIAN
jgi:hypothetical protein